MRSGFLWPTLKQFFGDGAWVTFGEFAFTVILNDQLKTINDQPESSHLHLFVTYAPVAPSKT